MHRYTEKIDGQFVVNNKQQTKSYRFRQLLGQKPTNSALISIFESYKLM